MTRHNDDPILTAYALGELDEIERRKVENRLTQDEACRRKVDEIRAVAARLEEELAREDAPGLTPLQRRRVERAATGLPPGRSRRLWPRAAGLAAAAVVATALALVAPRLVPDRDGPIDVDLAALAIQREQRAADRPVPPAQTVEPGDVANVNAPPLPDPEPVNASPPAPQVKTTKPAIVELDPRPEGALNLAAPERERTRRAKDESRAPTPMRQIVPPPVPELTETVTVVSESMLHKGSTQIVSDEDGFAAALPVVGRDYQSVLNKAPGVTDTDGDGNPNVHGARERHFKARVGGVGTTGPEAVPSTEAYDHIRDNPFILVSQDPLSTFSIDVDTASYSNVRRFLKQGTLPPPDAVRIEELVNYFSYDYAPPTGEHPFAAHVEVAAAPWAPDHRLVRFGLKGRVVEAAQRPPSNLVFLLDVSGSMGPPNKLPLVRRAMKLLVRQLTGGDRVAIVVYAGASGLVLPSTPADDPGAILDALGRLQAGGSTHGSDGLRLAYEVATLNRIPGGTNRVILCTDGDFNVGVTNKGELVRLIEEKAKSGVFLSVLGFGMGNYKDAALEQLADKGNGNYAYIDTFAEARKVLVEQMAGTLVTIAKDVKIQVEFNPAAASAYRLIGYENRMLRHQDFNDDTKDAGEIGAGHTVTALYEVVPVGVPVSVPRVDPLKYQTQAPVNEAAATDELLTLKLRYKRPDGATSTKLEIPVADDGLSWRAASDDFRFAASVAAFGMILRDSPHRGEVDLGQVQRWAEEAQGVDRHGYRAGFVKLVGRSQRLLSMRDDRP